MKPLIFALAFSTALGFSIAAEQSSATPYPITVSRGMTFADAAKLLADAGFSGEERLNDMELPAGTAIRYFPLNRNVDLVVTYTKASGQITYLSLMTSPSHRPVKGLEVDLPLSEITFAPDGSYTACFLAAKMTK